MFPPFFFIVVILCCIGGIMDEGIMEASISSAGLILSWREIPSGTILVSVI